MKPKRQLQIKYTFIDNEQMQHQEKLDNAYDAIFDDIEIADIERINNKVEYEKGHSHTS